MRFSIPAISGMVVNALYNTVDRIFIGRAVDEVALGGLSLVMPLMMIAMSFGMLFGGGSSNMISMRLGQGKRQEAENVLNHCFWLLLLFGLTTQIVQLVFLDRFLGMLGAQPGSVSVMYAKRYYRIILLGHPMGVLSFGLSSTIRAQGFPTISMVTQFLGAGLNFILDPLFVFVFPWGPEGVALATVISQAATLVWVLSFCLFNKKAVIRIRFKSFKPSMGIILKIASFGSPQFIMQFIMSGVSLLNNTSMGWYGADGLGVANGGDIALSALNIAGSCMMLFMMPIFGIGQGAQPIIGYNYGAKKFDRVIQAYKTAITIATMISTVGFLIVQLLPHFLVSIFAPRGSPEMLYFAPRVMRTQTIFLMFTGFQVLSSQFFVVTGRPKMSIFLSLLRQCLALIPCILIFGRIWGLYGVIAAAPTADGFSLCIVSTMIFLEMRKLQVKIKEQDQLQIAEAGA